MSQVSCKMPIKKGDKSAGGMNGWGAGVVLLAAGVASLAFPLILPVTAPIMFVATVVTLTTTLSVNWVRSLD